MKQKIKLILDLVMPLLLLFLMGYEYFGSALHEVAGMAEFAVFIIHHIINAKWYKNLFKGKYTPYRVAILVVDALVLFVMLMQMFTGIAIAKHLFRFLSISSGTALNRKIHIMCAFWGFILTSFHLGMHLNIVSSAIKKLFHIKVQKHITKIIYTAFGVLISAFGIYAFVSNNLIHYLFVKNDFVFVNYSSPKIIFYIQYITISGLFIVMGNCFANLIKNKRLLF